MKKLESSLKNMLLVLTIVTAISVALLAYVNALTEAPIAEAKANKLQTAIGLVVPEFDNNPAEQVDTIQVGDQVCKLYAALKGGEYVGSAVEAQAPAYGGALKILVGFNKAGEISGYSILEHAETPGLGSKVDTWFQADGKSSVIGKNPADEGFKVNKDNGEVDAITASTITSRAFINAIKTAFQAFQANTKEGGANGAVIDAASGATQSVESTDATTSQVDSSENNKE
ncbi:MAG: RnfABCDGE type electron transport complex subunit G [Bacteroides sp.]